MNKIKTCEGDVTQIPQLHIAVGVMNSARSELRVRVFLETLPDISVDYLYSGCDIDGFIQKADLVIGSKGVALKGVLHRKPVIVIGENGSGGVLTPESLIEQYHSGFLGKVHGELNEYFSFEQFEHDVQKSRYLSSPNLERMFNQLNNETLNERISQ